MAKPRTSNYKLHVTRWAGVEWPEVSPAITNDITNSIRNDNEESRGRVIAFGAELVDASAKVAAFQRREGRMQHLGYGIIDAHWFISYDITEHFDGIDYEDERLAHADLARHIFGNPFHPLHIPEVRDPAIVKLAERLYAGEAVASDLAEALLAAGHKELAEHFELRDHPRGCWALDMLLGWS